MGRNDWTDLTRRTNDPKLAFIERLLDEAQIDHRRNGESFHAPILQVRDQFMTAAWQIIGPYDSLPDDDPMFCQEEQLPLTAQRLELDPFSQELWNKIYDILMESGESLLNDEGVDSEVCRQVADSIVQEMRDQSIRILTEMYDHEQG